MTYGEPLAEGPDEKLRPMQGQSSHVRSKERLGPAAQRPEARGPPREESPVPGTDAPEERTLGATWNRFHPSLPSPPEPFTRGGGVEGSTKGRERSDTSRRSTERERDPFRTELPQAPTPGADPKTTVEVGQRPHIQLVYSSGDTSTGCVPRDSGEAGLEANPEGRRIVGRRRVDQEGVDGGSGQPVEGGENAGGAAVVENEAARSTRCNPPSGEHAADTHGVRRCVHAGTALARGHFRPGQQTRKKRQKDQQGRPRDRRVPSVPTPVPSLARAPIPMRPGPFTG